MNRHPLQDYVHSGTILLPNRHALCSIENVETVNHLSNDGVDIVEVRLWGIGEKELGSVGVWTIIGHGDYPTRAVSAFRMELVANGAAIDGLAPLTSATGVSALQHKPLHVAVKERLVV